MASSPLQVGSLRQPQMARHGRLQPRSQSRATWRGLPRVPPRSHLRTHTARREGPDGEESGTGGQSQTASDGSPQAPATALPIARENGNVWTSETACRSRSAIRELPQPCPAALCRTARQAVSRWRLSGTAASGGIGKTGIGLGKVPRGEARALATRAPAKTVLRRGRRGTQATSLVPLGAARAGGRRHDCRQ